MVSHLVADAFIGPRPLGMLVLHKNDIRDDNRARNLRYGTHKENVADSFRNGGRTRISLEIRRIIRKRRGKEKGRALALELGVSEQFVCAVYKGRK